MAKKILMCGNDAIGEAAIRAGCKFYAGYPITPQNELTAYMARRMPDVGGTFIQSESELAAINMVFGASVAGGRAMTSSSSPGISLKQEGISYLAACELPAVIVNIMRGGPGLGNIAPAQGDYFQATKGGGHGDYHTIVLAPSSVDEAARLTYLAFDLADKYRMPCMILGDGMLGQMMEPVSLDLKYKKRLPPKPWALRGAKGRKPNIIRSLLLRPAELEGLNNRLQRKYNAIRSSETRSEEYKTKDADVVIVAYGTMARIAYAAVDKARAKKIKAGLFRPITLWPFPSRHLVELSKRARSFLVTEMSAGQMVEDVRLSLEGRRPVRFYGRTGGMVPSCRELLSAIKKAMNGKYMRNNGSRH